MSMCRRFIVVGIFTSSLFFCVGQAQVKSDCIIAFDSLRARTHNFSSSEPVPDLAWELINHCPRNTAEDSSVLAWSYVAMIEIYDRRLEFEKALGCCDSASKIWDRLEPGLRKRALSTYMGASAIARRIGDFARSDSLYAKACRETLIVSFNDAYYTCATLRSFGEYWRFNGNVKRAESFYLRVADQIADSNGCPDEVPHQTFHTIGNLEQELGNYDQAERLHRMALEQRITLFGPVSRPVASSLCNIGNVFLARSQYDSALACYRDGLDICAQLPADSVSETQIVLLSNVADVNAKMGRFADAAATYEQLILIERDNPNRSLAAFYLNSAATIYFQMGDLDRATELLEEALALRRTVNDLPAPTIPANLAELAKIYVERANYQTAEQLYLDAINEHKRYYNADHPTLVDFYVPLGDLYLDLDRVEEAESTYREALRILDRKFGSTHDQIAQVQMCLARLHLRRDQLAESSKSLVEAKRIWKQLFGETHPALAKAAEVQSEIYLRSDRTTDALAQAQLSLDMRKQLFDSTHPSLGDSWHLIAEIQHKLGREKQALSACKEAEHCYSFAYNAAHPSIASIHELRAHIYLAQARPEAAFEAAAEALRIRYRHFCDNASAMSEKDALRYSKALRDSRDAMLNCYFCSSPLNSDMTIMCSDLVLKTKSLAMHDLTRNRQPLDSDNPAVEKLLASTRQAKASLLKKLVVGPQNQSTNEFRKSVSALNLLIETTARQIARLTSTTVPIIERPEGTTLAVRTRLNGAQAIEYIKFTGAAGTHYAAISLSRMSPPAIVDLGSARSIDSLVAEYMHHLDAVANRGFARAADMALYVPIGKRLYSQLVAPVLSEAVPIDPIVICPDGALNLLSFGTVIDNQGRYLIENHDIAYLTTAREIMAPSAVSASSPNSFLAIGNPDFNSDAMLLADNSADRKVLSAAPMKRGRNRSARSECFNLKSTALLPLSATRAELELVMKRCQSRSDSKCQLLTGASASEEALKRQCSSWRLIHFATHGFAMNSNCNGRNGSDLGIDDPMLYSGLFLAGANRAKERSLAGSEDGVLTSAEVVDLDLRQTELVVLSSCLSGSGTVIDGEGISGLRRAFMLAGAKSVISAMWRVPDIETGELMEQVYKSIDGQEAIDLSAAQRQSIALMRQEGRLDHPYYWGGFVMTGTTRK